MQAESTRSICPPGRTTSTKKKILDNLKQYGADTIELGVQSFDDKVLALSNRGHDSKVVYQACDLIKDYGFELGIQLMIGLPGDTMETCLYSARETVKIAPCDSPSLSHHRHQRYGASQSVSARRIRTALSGRSNSANQGDVQAPRRCRNQYHPRGSQEYGYHQRTRRDQRKYLPPRLSAAGGG